MAVAVAFAVVVEERVVVAVEFAVVVEERVVVAVAFAVVVEELSTHVEDPAVGAARVSSTRK